MTSADVSAQRAPLHRTWRGLPTAAKLVAILALLLLPLGIVAAVASARATGEARAQRAQLLRSRVQEDAGLISAHVSRARLALATAAEQSARLPCPVLERNLRVAGIDGPFALRAGGQVRCGTAIDGPAGGAAAVVGDGVIIASGSGPATGVARISRGELARALPPRAQELDLTLVGGGGSLSLRDDYRRPLLQRTLTIDAPLPGTPLSVRANAGGNPASAAEILSILLPLLMWLAASLVSWLVADRLLLRPIVRLRGSVLGWDPSKGGIRLPNLRTPATEIHELAQAFATIGNTVAARERDLEAGAGRQRLLVREVHHRVKNNLQVVSSLLNLHARGARTPEAAAAYAAILRRVDALAVVHRNHFAELEENRGVSLRTLLSELTANLRGNAAPGAERMAIVLDVDPVHTTQDVAVSVAFLVTEIVEYAMLCAPETSVTVALHRMDDSARARLSLRSDGLKDGLECEEVDSRQFERVTVGLARQLRSSLERDEQAGEFGVAIPVLNDDGAGPA